MEDIVVEFYNLYKETRIRLFKHLKEYNSNCDEEVLLEKSQKVLDRIIFICFCEDLGLLPANILQKVIQRANNSFTISKTPVWDEIRGLFKAIDQGSSEYNINAYNGGLFKEDKVLNGLLIKDYFFELIEQIADYDFNNDLDVNILGHIFEQSITDIAELKANIFSDEDEVKATQKKKTGIFYTPEYIAKYIVKNSIDVYLKKVREELGESDLPDVDSASTAQLKEKYKAAHLEFYRKYEEQLKKVKVLDPACGSGAFLTQAFDYLLEEYQKVYEKIDFLRNEYGQRSIFSLTPLQKEVLQNNIYGVDLNEEAVEITKLSLWLKTASQNQSLANLDSNIKVGNSLIEDEEIAGDKAFKWNQEFPQIMDNGGFDIVLGNPPWVSLTGKFANQISEGEIDYLINRYESNTYMPNLYEYFVKISLQLTKDGGVHSFIVPDRLGFNQQFVNLRERMLKNYTLMKLMYRVDFPGITTDTMVYTIKKSKPEKDHIIKVNAYGNDYLNIQQQDYLCHDNFTFDYFDNQEAYNIICKMEENKESILLGSIVKSTSGCGGKASKITETKESKEQIKVYKGEDIGRYQIKGCHYFEFKDENITGRTRDEEKLSFPEKVLLRKTGRSIIATYDDSGVFPEQSLYFLYEPKQEYDLKYILALMNSRLFSFYYTARLVTNLESMPQLKNHHLEKFPILELEKEKQEELVDLVDRLLELYEELNKLKNTSFIDLINGYISKGDLQLADIVGKDNSFYDKVYSGRASKVRAMTINIEDSILTLYADKASNGKYELIKFEVQDEAKQQYIKYYFENLSDEKLEEVNRFSGSLIQKTLQIEIPNYNQDEIVKRIVIDWNETQEKIKELEFSIKKIEQQIDRMVYNIYELTTEEIDVVSK